MPQEKVASVDAMMSLLAPDSLLEQVGVHYDLPQPMRCMLVSPGDNDSYLLSAGGTRYILRVYRHAKHWLENEGDYLFELEWLLFLKQRGLPVSAPCQRRDGSYLGRLRAPEGLRYWAIFDHVEGECVMDEVQSGLFGRAVAQIHLASNSFTSSHKRFTADLDWIVGDSIARLQGFLGQQHPALVEETARIAAGARAQIAALDFDDDAFGVIGGDFHGSNQHFTKDNRLGLFDFDLCSYGWRAYDIAVFRWSRGRSAELWQGFLRGYESLRPLSEVERQAIPSFVILRQVWLMGAHTAHPMATVKLMQKGWERMAEELQAYAAQASAKSRPT